MIFTYVCIYKYIGDVDVGRMCDQKLEKTLLQGKNIQRFSLRTGDSDTSALSLPLLISARS